MEYRLIALDLDGTLLSSRKEVTPRTREALAAARGRGIVTVIATGRAAPSALHFSRTIGGGPVICCNGGGVLEETGEFLFARGIPQAPLARCLALCREAGVLTECYTVRGIVMDQPYAHAKAYMRWVRPKMSAGRSLASLLRAWHTNRMVPVPSLLKWAEKPARPPVLKLMVIGKPEQLPELARSLGRCAPGLEVTSSAPDNLEVMAAGVTKGSALTQLGARLKIPREQMIAFGDSENDREMLTYAGTGVAMGNASDPVKAIADRIAPTCDEDGVARTIEELCLS